MMEEDLRMLLIEAKWALFQVGSCRTTCEACAEDADRMIKRIDAKLIPDNTVSEEKSREN